VHWSYSVERHCRFFWDTVYISRLCYDVSVRLSVRLSVTFVHCGHRVQWISDTFACLDRWTSLLLTDKASPVSSDGMMPGFLVEEGRGHPSRAILATARPSCCCWYRSSSVFVLSVCPSVGNHREFWKNGRLDWNNVWSDGPGGPKERCVLDRV